MVTEWTVDDLPAKFDDSRFPSHPWNPSPDLMADLAVWLNEHHPKPAREVTRQDLPSATALRERLNPDVRPDVIPSDFDPVLDAVVAHLNANGGLPTDDRWRRAHSIVEHERDQARSERDEWKAGAQEWQLLAKQERERAEAAEARTAVTREDVENVVHGSGGGFFDSRLDAIADAVCALFGVEAEPADPVEELAWQIEYATREAIRQVCVDLAGVAPSLDPLAVERAMEVTSASRKVAAHVLGQETDQ